MLRTISVKCFLTVQQAVRSRDISRHSRTLHGRRSCSSCPSLKAWALTQRNWKCERCFCLEQRPSRPHRSHKLITMKQYSQDNQTSNRRPLQEQHAYAILVPGKPPSLERATQPQRLSFWQSLGQNLNFVGMALFLRVLFANNRLALPHVSVPSIAWLDWESLRRAGFEGCVFDKDNTLTEPFSSVVAPQLTPALQRCQEAFQGRLVLLSNSAGLTQFDPAGEEADELEARLGIPVLRHSEKKPGGGAAALERHFGCPASRLIMIGDRYLTDMVYGNRHGMLTIRPSPLTLAGEPVAVRMARTIEGFFVARCRARGKTAVPHPSAASPEVIDTFVADNKIALW